MKHINGIKFAISAILLCVAIALIHTAWYSSAATAGRMILVFACGIAVGLLTAIDITTHKEEDIEKV